MTQANATDATAVLPFDNSYARLPEKFHRRVNPTPVAQPRLLRLNRPLAVELGLDADWLESTEGVAVLAGNRVPEGADPLATAYAGHQFGVWVPSLGDGRAILLGEVIDRNGLRRDIQLKGAGLTPFSRMGDGRAPLGPVIREYIVSEAMVALGIPTTRALAMVATGERVYRERVEPGAILTRVASGFVRAGTFEYFHRRGDRDATRVLADYVTARNYPQCAEADNPCRALLEAVVGRTAELVAAWMGVGFIHGVMNTDNLSIAGETIDYGPCAFMDMYHPGMVYSSIDVGGRYAFNQQPRVAYWNLAQFAETLLPHLAADEEVAIELARDALEVYAQRFEVAYHGRMARKIGIAQPREADRDLVHDLLKHMAAQRADFTLTFRGLCDVADAEGGDDAAVRMQFADPASFDAWAVEWRRRLADDPRTVAERCADMRSVNPARIPRNHRVQQAIDAAVERDDFAPVERLISAVAEPYADSDDFAEYERPPGAHEVVRQTFCGT